MEAAALLLLAEELSRCLGTLGTALACKLSQAHCEWDYQPSDRSNAKQQICTDPFCPDPASGGPAHQHTTLSLGTEAVIAVQHEGLKLLHRHSSKFACNFCRSSACQHTHHQLCLRRLMCSMSGLTCSAEVQLPLNDDLEMTCLT